MLRNAIRFKKAAALAILGLAFVQPSQAAPQERTIGVYFDAAGTQCHGTIAPNVPGTVYVLAKLTAGAPRMCGAAFRFTGKPATWQMFPVVNPNVIMLGDPFGRGVAMGWAPEAVTGDVLQLFHVLVLAASEESDVVFSLEVGTPPDNPGYSCPTLVNCGPTYSKECVSTVPCTVNSSATSPCAAPTAVKPERWSAVKELFR